MPHLIVLPITGERRGGPKETRNNLIKSFTNQFKQKSMKKVYLILTAAVGMTITSCTNNDYLGDGPGTNEALSEAINFGFELPNATRADKVGSDAATTLQNQFIVYGTKHASAEAANASNDKVAFQNYVVEYEANTAGHTESNTHNWEYVGKTPYAVAKVSPTVTSQGIKYWDYSAAEGYTFYGIASKADIATNNLVTVTKTTTGSTVYDKGYEVVIKNGANLDQLFVADRLPVAKTNYGKPVTLTFRNFGARVRVGFYETVPGYKVHINRFYYDDNAAAAVTTFAAMDVTNTTNFAAALQNINTSATTNTITVSYYDNTDASIENHARLAAQTADYNYALTLGTGVFAEYLKTSAADPTWDQAGGAYTTVLPLEANSNPMLLKIDYTLIPEDGSDGNIEVKNANVVVPTQYVKWKSNFAYTYLFKISDNTNGNTGIIGTDPEGLFPITFDAVVVNVADDKTQETITNFENYSITTYVNGSKVVTNDEYKVGETIYIVKENNADGAHTIVVPSGIGAAAGEVQVYKATTAGDAISEATVKANLTGSPNGITLTATTSPAEASRVADGLVPAADGTNYDFGANGAVKFTPNATGTYVVVYTRTVNVATTYTSVSGASWVAGTYYFKTSDDVYYPAAGISEANFDTYKANLYKVNVEGTPGVYDIKVIKVN